MSSIKATPERLSALREQCSGKAGHADAETVLHWDKGDPDHVEVYTTGRGADIARIIDRCGSAIESFQRSGDSVKLRIRKHHDGRKAFRGIEFAFAPVDVDSTPFPAGGQDE